jgi:phage terminase large subunit GpA-like protein
MSYEQKRYSSLKEIVADLSEIMLPPERISVSDAAAKYRVVYNPPAYVGPWDNETVPYNREVMDTLESRDYSAVCFVAPAQSGKTECISNWLAYNITCDPSDFMLVEKSQTEARNFSMMKIDRMLRHSPELGTRMLNSSSADNTFDKMFKSGTYLSIAWPTVNALSGKTIRRVALTDYDRFPVDIGGEGAAFDLARRRTNSYKRLGMTYVESSPSFDVSDHRWSPTTPHEAPPCDAGILGIYNRGDRRRWYWKCPHCADHFEPAFSLMRWPDSNDLMECAETAYMACPHCFETNGAIIESHQKRELNLGGVWIKDGETIDKHGNRSGTARRSDIASFWVKGPATAFGQWQTLVINYLLAMQEYESTGNDRPLKTTYNTDQGEPYIPPSLRDARTPEDLMDRAKDFGERVVPEGVRFLVASIDVQKHKFVVQVHGIKPALNTVDMVVIDRFDIQKSERRDEDNERYLVNPASYPEDWDLITTQVIERAYPLDDGSGRQMSIKLVGCDSGGRAGVTTRAYEYYRRLKQSGLAGRFYLLKGASHKSAPRVQKSFPDSDRKDRNAGARGEIPVLMLNTNILKDWVDAALGRTEPGAGYIEFADWLTLDFYKELCVETRNSKGEWENLKSLRNESWDLLEYCYALCVALRAEKIDWDNPGFSWAREWDKNTLVMHVDTTTGVKHNVKDESLSSKLEKLAKQVG